MLKHACLGTAVLGILGACGGPSVPSVQQNTAPQTNTASAPAAGPVASDDRGADFAVQGYFIGEAMGQRDFLVQAPSGWGRQHLCTEVFRIGETRIVDTMISGQTARVRYATPFTALRPAPPTLGRSGDWFPVAQCLNIVDDGQWSTGRTMDSFTEGYFERWESGWRMTRDPRRP